MRGEYSLQRAGRDERDRDRQAAPYRMGRATLVRITSSGANLALGKFAAGIIQTVLGPEEEGGTAVFEDVGTATVFVDQVGPSVPATGERVIAHRIPYRWVSRRKGAGCTLTLTLTARCGNGSDPGNPGVPGALVELLDATGTTVIASGVTPLVVTGLPSEPYYQWRVSKAGYHTRTGFTGGWGCGATAAGASAFTWPTTVTFTLHCFIRATNSFDLSVVECNLPGAAVVLSGGLVGSGTTDSAGNATMTCATSSSSYAGAVTATVTAPSGYGTANRTATVTIARPGFGSDSVRPCIDNSAEFRMFERSDHASVIANGRFIPRSLTHSDPYGTCTLTYVLGSLWTGVYVYTTNYGITSLKCQPTDPFAREVPYQTVSTPIGVSLTVVSSSCGDATWRFSRQQFGNVVQECDPPNNYTGGMYPGTFNPTNDGQVTDATIGITPALLLNFHDGPHTWGPILGQSGDMPESEVDATITGTIL